MILRRRTMGVVSTPMTIGVINFKYTGSVQKITLPIGTYRLECWGAKGGSNPYNGGYGGYSKGTLKLKKQTTLFVYVGSSGGSSGLKTGRGEGGFNGGGDGYTIRTSDLSRANCGGGGASDIRIGQDSLYSRVIVAGGGGGAGTYEDNNTWLRGGSGGGLTGGTGSQYNSNNKAGTGGSQTARGASYYGTTVNSTTYGTRAAFGKGGGAKSGTTLYPIAGGGGGWYGGGYGADASGGGGSGYVYTEDTAANYPDGCLLNSSYYLINAETINNVSTGNGFVRITILDFYASKFVDLGLPSGTLWAKGNLCKDSQDNYYIGAETDYGAYFSWGNIVGHESANGRTFDDGYDFSSSNYASTPGKNVTADIASNDAQHNAALACLGVPWRLPRKEKFEELYDNTDREWTKINGVSGWKFMKKTDHSVYVFFPAAGIGTGTSLADRGSYGHYLSSSYSSSSQASRMYFYSSSVYPKHNYTRFFGLSVRATL